MENEPGTGNAGKSSKRLSQGMSRFPKERINAFHFPMSFEEFPFLIAAVILALLPIIVALIVF